jgi:hypothetical protein
MNAGRSGVALGLGAAFDGLRVSGVGGGASGTLALGLRRSDAVEMALGLDTSVDGSGTVAVDRASLTVPGPRGFELSTPDASFDYSVLTTPPSKSMVLSAGGVIDEALGSAAGKSNAITIDAVTNYVGIGLSNGMVPEFPLHLEGEFFTAGDVVAFSDIRGKEDLEVIDDALERLKTLTGYTFAFKASAVKRRSTGLVAQDVQKVLPEAVHVSPRAAG